MSGKEQSVDDALIAQILMTTQKNDPAGRILVVLTGRCFCVSQAIAAPSCQLTLQLTLAQGHINVYLSEWQPSLTATAACGPGS